ncbi:MAG: allantoin permease [Streptosporangiales bacterium]|nr:allantoin permease [Streptosporangiales bacterium]
MSPALDQRTDRKAPADEVPYTLEAPAPRPLSFADQGAFWANLGVSLLGFSGAYTVLAPPGAAPLSLVAALVATAVGTLLGSVMVGLAAIPGARTGAPSMVLLRGLFGTRPSYVPTVLNIVQLIGWGTFELIVIAQAAQSILGDAVPRWVCVVAAGVLTTALTLRPLGAVRLLRRYVTIAVVIAMGYFAWRLLSEPLPALTEGSWTGFWAGADAALAVAVSWVPLAADYSRHSRTPGTAFGSAVTAYSITQTACYALGFVALILVAGDPDRVFDPFLAVPLGALFFAVLVLREVDQSFANVYSTAVSVQNLRPKADRRVLCLGIGALTTVLAVIFDIGAYAEFLLLIGSVFVPLLAVLVVDYFLFSRGREWNISTDAPVRYGMLLAWVLGFVAHHVVAPGGGGWWTHLWTEAQRLIGYTPQSWVSASLLSFLVAGGVAAVVDLVAARRRGA